MKTVYASRSFATFSLMLSISFGAPREISAQGQRRGFNFGGVNIAVPRPQFDPFKNSGLEGGGWQKGIIPYPQPSTSTVWPIVGNPQIPHGHPPGQNPTYPSGPMSTKPYVFPPGTFIPASNQPGNPVILNGANSGFPSGNPAGNPALGGYQGVNPGFPSGNPAVNPGPGGDQGANPAFPNGNPAVNPGPGGDQGFSGGDPGGPGLDGSNVGPAGDVSMPGGDPAGTGDPGPFPGQGGFPSVVVVNQTGLMLAIAAKFVDPNSGQWIVAWNNSVSPGQAVRVGYTNNGTIYLHAEATNASGQVVTIVDGSDTSFDTPRGALGMAQGNFTQQGNDLVSYIATQ